MNFSDTVNVVCSGSPSRIRMVRRISLGMTTLPRSSIRRTIPVAFIKISFSLLYIALIRADNIRPHKFSNCVVRICKSRGFILHKLHQINFHIYVLFCKQIFLYFVHLSKFFKKNYQSPCLINSNKGFGFSF